MKLYAVQPGFGKFFPPELIDVEAVENKRSYKIDGEKSAFRWRSQIRKDELKNLRIGETPEEAVRLFIEHHHAKVSTKRVALEKAQQALYEALDFERRFNDRATNGTDIDPGEEG